LWNCEPAALDTRPAAVCSEQRGREGVPNPKPVVHAVAGRFRCSLEFGTFLHSWSVLSAGLKYIKLKLVHTHDSVLKRPCVYGVVRTSFLFCRRLTTTEEAHVSNCSLEL
jgi:hypothetical protein